MNGIRVGQLIGKIKSNLWWYTPFKPGYKYPKKENRFWSDVKAFSKLRHITCDYCGAKGLDFQSEKHGWNYEGYHFWKCADCLKEKLNEK